MKKIIALLCVALLCLGFAACGEEKPAPVNNGGRYVQYGGAVYYWKYNTDCIEPSGVWGQFMDVPGVRRDMARLHADGGEETVFSEEGYGGIWIYDGRFYLTKLDDKGDSHVFSTSMTGEDSRAIGPGVIFALDEARGLLIITRPTDDSVSVYDMNSQTKEPLPIMHAELLLYDAAGAALYYRDYGLGEYDVVKLCSVNIETGQARDIAMLELADCEALAEAQWVEFKGTRLEGDTLHIFLAGYGGTAHMYYGSAAFAVDMAGDGVLRDETPKESDWFGVNQPFHLGGEGPFESQVSDFAWYVCPGGGEAPKAVLLEEELAALGLPGGPYYYDDAFADVREAELVDGAVFFSVWQGPRNEAEDIGWRSAYGFGGAHVYRKDLSSGEIKELYAVAAPEK